MIKKSLSLLVLFFVVIILNSAIAYAQGYGDILDHWDGESIYYNGEWPSDQAKNGKYQCVELIMRYYEDKYGYSRTLWKGKSAAGFFDKGNHPSDLVQIYNGTGNASLPQPGDVLVFDKNSDWQYGHVALVTGVSNGSVTFVQQNVGTKTRDSLPLDPNFRIGAERGGIDYPRVIGWLHRRSELEQLEQNFSGGVASLLGSAPESESSARPRPLTGTPSGNQPNLAEPGITPQTLPIITATGVTITPQSQLGKPSLSSPSNGASMPQSTAVALLWNPLSGATQYKVEVWGGPYGVMPSCDWQGGTSCSIGKMWPGTMSWHVKARNSSGQESDWSDTWSFTIEQAAIITPSPVATEWPPDQFHLISPSGDVQLPNGVLPNLQWQSTSDPDGDQVQYDVMIDNANSPKARQPGQPDHIESGLLTGVSWQPTGYGLEKGGRYTWYVLADDGHGNRTGSIEHWQFTIALPHVSSAYDPCPFGIGPASPQYPSGIKPGSYPPTTLTQDQRQWLFEIFGNKGLASVGYGGQECGKPAPTSVPPPSSTNTPVSTSAPAIVTMRPPSLTPTYTPIPPPTPPVLKPCPCPTCVGPASSQYPAGIRTGSYPPTSLTQEQRDWLFHEFGHSGQASVGYGGEECAR